MPVADLAAAISSYGTSVAARFAMGGGEPEDLIRGPFENLLGAVAGLAGVPGVVPAGEHHLADERVRPDYAIYVDRVLVGFAELKAPGKGSEPVRFKGHDRVQWRRLALLPNVLYTDGQSFALYRDGERLGPSIRLVGDVATAGPALGVPDQAAFLQLFRDFLGWQPVSPRLPKELAKVTARLCRLLRTEVEELLVVDEGLKALAQDWRWLLFPEATDAEFADGYAQAITFALLLARVEGIALADRKLDDIAEDLGQKHTLMGRALDVLTDAAVLDRLAVSVTTLQRVLAVVDWPTISRGDPAAWLYFYEEFLDGYDPALRRATGSYYTPVEVVDPMVRMVDELLRTRLGHAGGFASSGVTVIDPCVGTGTFLHRIIDKVADTVEDDLGLGAVGPAMRKTAGRLIGFELQAGPYAVAELRLAGEYARRGAPLGRRELRLYLTDTLGNPYVAEQHLPAVYTAIAESRTRANEIKRDEPVLVVIGNPPYRERSKGRGGWIEEGNPDALQPAPFADWLPPREWRLGAHAKHLYNPYVYFWRWATWKVFESHPADRGVVAFITVAGFLNGPGFAAMRDHLRRTSDAIWVIDCSPEGHQPEVPTRVFQGVQQPVCITIALRDGTTGVEAPAPVRFASLHGRREEKFTELAALGLDGAQWAECPTDWRAPFLPAHGAAWAAHPALDELLPWSGSGTMAGRTWVVSPSTTTLRLRWLRLISAPLGDKAALLAEHPQDRRIDTVLSDNLPGYAAKGPLVAETTTLPATERVAWRSFDRQWIVADKRVINRPNPGLWQVRRAPGQLYLTCLSRTSPSAGPAATASALVPDLHHYKGSFGGRAWPLWLDATGTRPNVAPGLLDHLAAVYETSVSGPDMFSYVAAVVAHPGYVATFKEALGVPGLRVPLTASRAVFAEALKLGRRVLWLQTFGERFTEPQAGRPGGSPRLEPARRPKVTRTIVDTDEGMPSTIDYEASTRALHVGDGLVAPVEPAVWAYEVSGMKVLKRWFDRRKKDPDGRRSSPLEDIVASTWDPEWTRELIEVINVLTLLVELEPAQAALLGRVLDGPLLTVADLTSAGVLPTVAPPTVEQPPRPGARLFD